MPQNDKMLLQCLSDHKVEFVVIGGVCGVLHGIALVTFDLDICCRFSRENLRRLEASMKDLHPRHRLTADKLPFELTDELGDTLKNIYLTTDLGILDCRGTVAGVGDYEQALQCSTTEHMSCGEIKILNLDTLIAGKQAAGREKELYAVNCSAP
jgi:hypothetical protein